MRTLARVAVGACLLLGCAPFLGQTRDPSYVGNGTGAVSLPAIVGYQDSLGPLSYRSPSVGPASDREVRGEACQSAVTLPFGLVWAAIKAGNPAFAPAFLGVAWGEGGYAQALSAALKSAPNARVVNVRADLNTKIILGIWRQQCVRLVATVVAAN
jgi:hypothetical protein